MGVAVTICVRLISCAATAAIYFFHIYPPVPLTLHRGLAPFGATAPLKFYISFRCTNKTAEEDIFVEKNLCKTARTCHPTPKLFAIFT
ncbi:MAG: hypothetical protein K940chlam7_00233 [Chlamydiae bacterium]|nr:hypothetical protein [Chlamydiota bacterium]